MDEEDEIVCPHCGELITQEERDAYWMKQAKLTEERLKSQSSDRGS